MTSGGGTGEGLESGVASTLREAAAPLTRRWLARIADRVALAPEQVFPTEDLLDHMPLLIQGIADHLADPSGEISTDVPVVRKARELGALRFRQGFGLYEILKEYEILGGILFHFVEERVAAGASADGRRAIALGGRLYQAIAAVLQATAVQFAADLTEQLRDRENRLRAAQRLVSHEMRNRLGAYIGAVEVLGSESLPAAQRSEMAAVIRGNVHALQELGESLLLLTRVHDLRREQHVPLAAAAREARRKLRHMAMAADVELEMEDPLPAVEVPAATVEHCLSNYLSNAIKYSDPRARRRWARILAWTEDDCTDGIPRVVVEVRDNGIGVPARDRPRLFTPFARSETAMTRSVQGLGLGLSTVRETVEELGGRAWARFDEGESAFLFSLPCRRAADEKE